MNFCLIRIVLDSQLIVGSLSFRAWTHNFNIPKSARNSTTFIQILQMDTGSIQVALNISQWYGSATAQSLRTNDLQNISTSQFNPQSTLIALKRNRRTYKNYV